MLLSEPQDTGADLRFDIADFEIGGTDLVRHRRGREGQRGKPEQQEADHSPTSGIGLVFGLATGVSGRSFHGSGHWMWMS